MKVKSTTFNVRLYLILSVLFSLYGIYFYNVSLSEIALILIGYTLYFGIGIFVCFHRLLTHKSYSTYPLIEKIMSVFGILANTGSSLVWCTIHLKHHLFSDKVGDPHSPKTVGNKIFLFSYDFPENDKIKWKLRYLIKDRFHIFLHSYYILILIGYDIFLYLIGGLYLVIFLHLIPVVLISIFSNLLNYYGHKQTFFSYRRYKLNDDSENNWLLAIPSFGESWHNNHHRYPKRYRLGEKWWEIDLGYFFIKLIKV